MLPRVQDYLPTYSDATAWCWRRNSRRLIPCLYLYADYDTYLDVFSTEHSTITRPVHCQCLHVVYHLPDDHGLSDLQNREYYSLMIPGVG